jgi:hypothetical protein
MKTAFITLAALGGITWIKATVKINHVPNP